MSMKKIQKNNAEAIGLAMARKAFEHILLPLQKEREYFGKLVYDNTLEKLGLTTEYLKLLDDSNVLSEHTYHACNLTITDTNAADNNDAASIHIGHTWTNWGYSKSTRGFDTEEEHNEHYPSIYAFHKLTVRDTACLEEAKKLQVAIDPHAKKANALCAAITKQIVGRTCKEVMRDWPEAAPFVIKEMELNNKPDPMMKPLEDLIGRFLLALPAPVGA